MQTQKKSTNSARQQAYTARLKAKGYVLLTSLYVPLAIRDKMRELVKSEVAKFESQQF
jgi:hypothetical protein